MFLVTIEIKNYRGIKHLKIANLKRHNFFIGRNGVGKSSLICAINRLAPILYKQENTFKDGDFRFRSS